MDTPASNVVKQINEAVDKDPRTQKALIDVGYNQGVVTLTGTVKSRDALQAAEEIARAQQGVLSVVNELKVA